MARIAGYACAAVLLISVGLTPWVQLLFPVWIALLSVHILWRPMGGRSSTGSPGRNESFDPTGISAAGRA